MIIGLRTRDEQGNVLVDMTRPVSRVVGSFDTGTAAGSISVALPAGQPFFVQTPLVNAGRAGKQAAVVYLGGGQFSWSWSFPSGVGNYAISSRIYYGVY